MKKLRKITRGQRQILTDNGYNSYDWLLERQTQDGFTFVHKDTKEVITLQPKR